MSKTQPINKIPLYDIKLSKQAIISANEVLKSGWLSPGKKTASFEQEICRLTKCSYGVSVSSATNGMQLVLMSLGIGPGDEIVTTPFTFVATIEAILAVGATPVFADIDPLTLNIDPEEVYRKISDKTQTVIPVDIAGHPNNYDLLNKICEQYKIPLISDSAHSIGTTYKRKSIARWTDVSIISFHATKNLICGEGGIVLTKHKPIAETVRLLSRHGLTSTAIERKKKNGWEYDAIAPGFKANMSELHAAIGLGQLTVFNKEQETRTKLAERYIKNLTSQSDFFEIPHEDKNTKNGWHLFIIRLHLSKLKIDRDKFIQLMKKQGIECGVHYKPIFELSFYKEALNMNPRYYPNTAYAGKRVVTLPLYPSLTLKQVDRICEVIESIVKKHKK